MNDRPSCPECSAPTVEGSPFCLECGARVSLASSAPEVANEASSSELRPQQPPAIHAEAGGPSPIAAAGPAGPETRNLSSEGTPTPLSEPVIPLPSTAQTQPMGAPPLKADIPTSGEGAAASIPDDVHEAPAFQKDDMVLRQYRIVRELGRGGMGAVYLAKDDLSGQQVAVKVLPAALAREKGIRERFTQEARALAALDHPNIVPLISYAQNGDDRFLIMKYVEGTPLDDVIEKNGKLSFERSEAIFRDLVRALGYAHAAGVVHRDVKPANVLIADDGRLFLVDFGIAKKEESAKLTQTGMLMGTPQYMSPELISGHPVDGRSDLYAAGLILFEMLTGRTPFVGERTFTILRAHVEGVVPDPCQLRGETIPTPLLAVIDRVLKKRPKDRPADAEGVLDVLDAANLETPIFGVEAGTTEREFYKDTPATLARFEQMEAFENEVTAAFGKARSRSMTVFGVGALLLAVALVAVVISLQPAPEKTVARTKMPGEEEAMALLNVAKRKKKAKDYRGALEILRSIQKPASDLAPIVLTELDLHLELGDLKEAVLLSQSLDGYVAQLTPPQVQRLRASQAKLKALKQAREQRANRAAARRARLPTELSNKQIQQVTQGQKSQAAVTLCWNETVLRVNPSAQGTLQIEIEVTTAGTVKAAKIIKDTIGSDRLEQCVEKVARGWRFPEVRGPQNWHVVQTYDFDSGS